IPLGGAGGDVVSRFPLVNAFPYELGRGRRFAATWFLQLTGSPVPLPWFVRCRRSVAKLRRRRQQGHALPTIYPLREYTETRRCTCRQFSGRRSCYGSCRSPPFLVFPFFLVFALLVCEEFVNPQ